MKNAEFYQQVADIQPVKEKPRSKIKWGQVLAIAGLFVFFFPMYPGRLGHRGFPETWTDYVMRASFAIILVAAFGIVVFWVRIVKPRFENKNRYKYEGVFEVTNKISKPKKRLILRPGTDHLVSVDSNFFKQVEIGDKVQVERKPTGEIILVKKTGSVSI